MGIIQTNIKSRGVVETDPHYANVFLICGFEGTVNDDKGRVGTAANGAATSTSFPKAGANSLTLPSDNSRVTYADSADFDIGTADFTFEFTIRTPASLSGVYREIISHRGDPGGWTVGIEEVGGLPNRFQYGSGTGLPLRVSSAVIAPNTTYDVALVRVGGIVYFYVNGTRGVGDFDSVSLGGTASLTIGDSGGGFGPGGSFIDEIRLTKNVARYTGTSYTPRTTAFPRA